MCIRDRHDLTKLYRLAWGGQLTNINGTPIRFVSPYSTMAEPCGPEVGEMLPDTSYAAARSAGY